MLLTLMELSADEHISTGSLAKKCNEIIELSWASLTTDCSFLFSRFQMLITPEEPPEAKSGCPSKRTGKKIFKLDSNHKNNVTLISKTQIIDLKKNNLLTCTERQCSHSTARGMRKRNHLFIIPNIMHMNLPISTTNRNNIQCWRRHTTTDRRTPPFKRMQHFLRTRIPKL